jgi:hypothetical protein
MIDAPREVGAGCMELSCAAVKSGSRLAIKPNASKTAVAFLCGDKRPQKN